MHNIVKTWFLISVNDAGEGSISAVRSCLASPTLKFKMKLTAGKIPNPAVAFWMNHPTSLCPSLLSTLHLCSFILCWRAGGGLRCVVEGLGMTVAFLLEQLPRSSWISPGGSFIFYLQVYRRCDVNINNSFDDIACQLGVTPLLVQCLCCPLCSLYVAPPPTHTHTPTPHVLHPSPSPSPPSLEAPARLF